MISRRAVSSLVLVACFLIAATGLAQKKESTGPRAVAVLEWTGQGLRLIPISLLINGQFYDASLYRANPIPLSLDQGNIYQVQNGGEAVGDFTVTMAGQAPNGSWVGEGTWLSEVERQSQQEKREKAAAAREAAAAAERAHDPKDDRPVLRRGKAGPADVPASPAPTSSPSSSPAPSGSASPSASAPVSSSAPATSAPKPAPAPTPALTETSSDANRPILRRGKTTEEQAQKLGNEKTVFKKPQPPPAGIRNVQVAVSDASATEARPYTWSWKGPEEQQKVRELVEKLAMAEVTAYAAKVNGPKPGAFEDVNVHAFDLAYNNSPDVIFTAKVVPAVAAPARKGTGSTQTPPVPEAPAGFEYYVTVIGRQDIYAQLKKNFSAVTDNRHLDAFPRMELVDAVDADGNGAGDLLFRRITDTSSAYVLYKVYGSRLDELVSVPEPKLMP